MKPSSKNDQRIGLKVNKKAAKIHRKTLRLSESMENYSIA